MGRNYSSTLKTPHHKMGCISVISYFKLLNMFSFLKKFLLTKLQEFKSCVTTWPRDYKTVFMLNSAEYEI